MTQNQQLSDAPPLNTPGSGLAEIPWSKATEGGLQELAWGAPRTNTAEGRPKTSSPAGSVRGSKGALDPALVDGIASAEGLSPRQRQVMNALLEQESGFGRNAVTSTDGAQGAGQIMPGTFKLYAKPGEDIHNTSHNLAVMGRLIKDLGGKFGDDPGKIAAGYFSGEGNVNRGQGSAWKNDRRDGNGKSVSGYVNDVLARVAGAGEARAAEPAPSPDKAPPALPDLANTPKWRDIAAGQKYQKLPDADKQKLQAAYFDEVIAPHAKAAGADVAAVRQKFMTAEPGLLDKIGDGMNAVRDAMTGIGSQMFDRNGSVLDRPGVPSAADLPTTSKAPVERKVRLQAEADYDKATPELRQAMMQQPGWRGQLARERAGVFERLDQGMQGMPAAAALNKLDPRIEARRQRYPAASPSAPAVGMGDAAIEAATGAVGAVGDTTRNLTAGVLKIGPTALKGVADVGNMLTADSVDMGVSKSMQSGMEAIDNTVGTAKFNQQQKGFEALMADDTQSIGDMFGYLLDNPSILVDNSITTIGSMFLPAAAAKGAVVAAGMRGASAAATTKAAVAASIGTSAAQNAADTFSALEKQSLSARYQGAAISAGVSILMGVATGGGAEGQIAKKLAGDLQTGRVGLSVVKEFLKTVGKEATQEAGEEFGNAAGEAVGSSTAMNPLATSKRAAFAGTLGGLMGGGTHALTSIEESPERQIAREIENGVKGTQFTGVDEAARTALDPQGLDARLVNPDQTVRQASDVGPAPSLKPAVAEITPDGRIDVHPTVQAADDIVRELATAAGISHETVLPNTAVATEPIAPTAIDSVEQGAEPSGNTGELPGAQDFTDQDEARAAELWMKSGDGTITLQEQDELHALQTALTASKTVQLPATDQAVQLPGGTPESQEQAAVVKDSLTTQEQAPTTEDSSVVQLEPAAEPDLPRAFVDVGKPKTEKEARAQRAQLKELTHGTQAPEAVKTEAQGQETLATTDPIAPPRTEKEARARRAAAKEHGISQPEAPSAQSLPMQAATENVAPETSVPQQLGHDNTPLSEGGKPFKTRLSAAEAKKFQPMMRVVSVDGGFALADKTPKQLAAEAKAARRLRNPQTSASGEPIPAHAFIAAEGGLHADTKADMNMGGNPRIGNRMLFGGAGKGLSMERATARLIEEGYLDEGASHSQAMALIKRSLTQPQYNADGYERIAEGESQARFDDYLQAEHETTSDPFVLDDADLLELAGHHDLSSESQKAFDALVAAAEAEGIDTESILLDAHEATLDGTTDDYQKLATSRIEDARKLSQETIERARAEQGRPTTEPGGAGRGREVPGAQGTKDAASQVDPAAQATAILDAAKVTGKERIDVLKDVKKGDVTPEELQAAYPAKDEGLTAPSKQDILDQQQRAEAAAKSEKAQQRAADELARRERERKDIAKASEAAADTFTLGGDAEQNLSGQGGMFDEAAPAPAAKAGAKPTSDNPARPIKTGDVLRKNGHDYTVVEVSGNVVDAERVIEKGNGLTRKEGIALTAMEAIEAREAGNAAMGSDRAADVGAASGRQGMFDAPESKPERKIQQTDTPAFKAWFGDSKAVDANGKPLVVYHGTPNGGFSTFDMAKAGTRASYASAKLGMYFSAMPRYANAMARDVNESSPTVYPVYLKLENPLRVFTTETDSAEETAQMMADAKADGHDGVIDEYGNFVVFESAQIKSAIGNNGEFDAGNDDIRFSFAGQNAATADQHSLATAQARLDAGEDAEGVRQDTGWSQGADDKWRFEISDADASLNAPMLANLSTGGWSQFKARSVSYLIEDDGSYSLTIVPENAQRTSEIATLTRIPPAMLNAILPDAILAKIKHNDGAPGYVGDFRDAQEISEPFSFDGFNALPLDEVLKHPALFAAYPALREVMVQVNPKLGQNASFSTIDYSDGTQGKIIRVGSLRDSKQVLSALLHEIQHGIQDVEGFAMGGSPASATGYDAQVSAELTDLLQSSPQLQAIYDEWAGYQNDMDAGRSFDVAAAENVEAVLEAAPGGRKAMDLHGTLEGLSDPDSAPSVIKNRYRRLAGEVEARNTQARQGMTAAERRAMAPESTADVKNSDVIVTFNGKEMASAPPPANAQVEGDGYTDGHERQIPDQAAEDADTQRAIDTLTRGFGRPGLLALPFQGRRSAQGQAVLPIADSFGARVVEVALRPGLTPEQIKQFGDFNGAYYKEVLYLRVDSQRPHLALLGHEIAHLMRKQRPDLYAQMVKAIDPYIKRTEYESKFRGSTTAPAHLSEDAQKEEFIGEVLSDGFMDKDFWRALGTRNKGLLARVAKFVNDLINKALSTVGYTRRTEQYLTDYTKVMELAGEVMAEFGLTAELASAAVRPDNLKFSGADHGRDRRNNEADGLRRDGSDQNAATTVAGVPASQGWAGATRIRGARGPITVYRGASQKLEAKHFDLGSLGFSSKNPSSGLGVWFSNSKREADSYGNAEGMHLDIRNPKFIRFSELPGFDSTAEANAWREKLRKQGHDGLVIHERGLGKKEMHFVAFDAAQAVYPDEALKFNAKDARTTGPQSPLPLANGKAVSSWDAPAIGRMDKFIYEIQDRQIHLKRVQAAIAETASIPEQFDAYKKEELYHGRVAARTHKFLDRDIKPLLMDMKLKGVSMDELEAYLWARHAPERNAQIATINPDMPDGGSGLSDAQAMAFFAGADVLDEDGMLIVKGMKTADKNRLEALAGRIDAINKGTKQVLLQYGLETADTIQAWESTYKNYVPLYREGMDTGTAIGQGFSTKGTASKRAMGSKLRVTDILAHLALQREAAITRGEKNRVGLALYGLAIQNKNAEFWETDKVPMIKQINKDTGLVESVPDRNWKQHDNAFVVRVGGQDRAVIFNERSEQAMRMVKVLKNLDLTEMGIVTEKIAPITRYFAAISTQYNPVFGVVNGVRDFQAATLGLSSTKLAGKQVAFAAAVPGAMKAIWQIERGGKSGTAFDALYEEMKMAGGTTGYREIFRMGNERDVAIQKQIAAQDAGLTKKSATAVLDALDHYNTAIENGTRLAVFKVAKDMGLSNEEAASIAKNITVNFNRKGRLSHHVGPWYMFFNSAVQGTARFIETLRGPAGKKVMMGGVMLGVMQAMLAAWAFDDDEWEDIPEFVKQRNLIIPTGKRTEKGGHDYIMIPMALSFNILPNIGRISTEVAKSGGKDIGKRAVDLMLMIAEAGNPFGSSTFPQMLAPTIADPLVALSENKDFTGRDIAKTDMNPLAPTPGFTRARDSSSHLARGAAQLINTVSGGTKYTPGMWSPTPDQLDYIFGALTGGVGREANKGYQSLELMARGENVPENKKPLAGRFFGTTDEDSAVSARYWTNVRELNLLEMEIKGRRKDHQDVIEFKKERPEASVLKQANRFETMISEARSQRHKIEFDEKINEEERTQKLKAKDELILQRMRRLNAIVANAKKPKPAELADQP